ncbi:MAG: hypothetical protein K2N85_02910 [Lachnospiraceae bacterium]|nr:hypothetical protein [Lachnospiraceae bacterium]
MKTKTKRTFSILMTVITLILCMSVCTACGKTQESANIEGELTDILAQIYEGADLDSETKEAMATAYYTDVLTEDNATLFLGTSEVSYVEGIISAPLMNVIPYQCVLLRVNSEDVDSVKTLLLENADLNKWVCVSADTAKAENIGDLVLFVMGEQNVADAVVASFKALK